MVVEWFKGNALRMVQKRFSPSKRRTCTSDVESVQKIVGLNIYKYIIYIYIYIYICMYFFSIFIYMTTPEA